MKSLLVGTRFSDIINGTAEDDILSSDQGNDTLSGGEGNDTLIGQPGDDLLFGGPGNDLLYGKSQNDAHYGEDGDDILIVADADLTAVGGLGDDVITDFGGLSRFDGGEGNDLLDGDTHGDTLAGGADNDAVLGGSGNDVMDGGLGDDRLIGEAGRDQMTGGGGKDTFAFLATGDSRPATSLRDRITDFGSDDVLDLHAFDAHVGLDGDQMLTFRGTKAFNAPGQVRAIIANGSTIVRVSTDSDAAAEMEIELAGFTGTLTADNFVFAKSPRATAEADLAFSLSANDTIDGGAGNDVLIGNGSADQLLGGDGDDYLSGRVGNDAIDGGGGDDLVMGGLGNDSIVGGTGNDKAFAGFGDDWLEGGDGDDMLEGNDGSDTVLGGSGNDLLLGADKADSLSGGDGDDIINPGRSVDISSGGLGDDIFVFTARDDSHASPTSRDRIEDFSQIEGNDDLIHLSGIDADTKRAGDQAYSFVGEDAFTAAAQLRWQRIDADVVIQGNTDADLDPEFEILLVNFGGTLAADDFML